MSKTKKARDMIVTMEMLEDTRKELKADITSVSLGVKRVESKLDGLSNRLEQVDTRLTGKIEELDERLTGKIEELDVRLNARIDELDQRLSGKIDVLDARLTAMDLKWQKRFDEMEQRWDVRHKELKAHIEMLTYRWDSRFEEMQASIHRVLAIYEEQEIRNRYVLDGYQSLSDRLDNLEVRQKTDILEVRAMFERVHN